MKNGKCPNCGVASVYTSEQGLKYGKGGVYVENLGERMIVAIPYQSYICTKCGHFENYIFDQAKLSKIEQKWKKVE